MSRFFSTECIEYPASNGYAPLRVPIIVNINHIVSIWECPNEQPGIEGAASILTMDSGSKFVCPGGIESFIGPCGLNVVHSKEPRDV